MSRPSEGSDAAAPDEAGLAHSLPAPGATLRTARTVALVGMMGAGKSSIGRRLASILALPFFDADSEIELAAGQTIPEIFAAHGEAEFRRGERQVMARLLRQPQCVLATGGGAVLDAGTRALLRERAVTIWLRASPDILMRRIERRDTRPLLQQPDPRAVLERLLQARQPLYAEVADLTVESGPGPQARAVEACLAALAGWRAGGERSAGAP